MEHTKTKQFFLMLRWETTHISKVKVSKLDRTKHSKEQSVYMPQIRDIPRCAEHLMPLKVGVSKITYLEHKNCQIPGVWFWFLPRTKENKVGSRTGPRTSSGSLVLGTRTNPINASIAMGQVSDPFSA